MDKEYERCFAQVQAVNPDLNERTVKALAVFTAEEQQKLTAFFRFPSNDFIGLGIPGPDGNICQFADPVKAEALGVLEEEFRKELMRIRNDNGNGYPRSLPRVEE